jgi:hypothetical protein
MKNWFEVGRVYSLRAGALVVQVSHPRSYAGWCWRRVTNQERAEEVTRKIEELRRNP